MQRIEKKSENIILFVNNDNIIPIDIRKKINLLRNSDTLKNIKPSEVLYFIEKKQVNSIIFYCTGDDGVYSELLKDIKKEEKFSKIPTILIERNCSDDFLIDMSDMGVDEIIHGKTENWELLIRILKILNKASLNEKETLKDDILHKLNAVNSNGIFREEYLDYIMTRMTEESLQNNISSCVLLLAPKNTEENENDFFEKLLIQNLRNNDIIIRTEDMHYYIFLQHTKLPQAYSLFEKLKACFEPDIKIGAGITDINDKDFAQTRKKLDSGLRKTLQTSGSLAVVINSDKTDVKYSLREPEKQKAELPDIQNIMEEDNSDYEIFHQTYRKKCKLIIEPTFKKLKNIIDSQNISDIFVDYSVEFSKSVFKIISNSDEFYLTIRYNGITKVMIDTVHVTDNKMFDTKPLEIEIMEFSIKKLTDYIEEVIEGIKL